MKIASVYQSLIRKALITKDDENKKIKKELLNDYINDGWVKGRK
jgi:hypothetical protein